MAPSLAFAKQTEDRQLETPSQSYNQTALDEQADWVRRAEILLSHEIDFVMHQSFRKLSDSEAASEGKVLEEALSLAECSATSVKKNPGFNAHYQRMCETPLLSAALERACFRRYNWLKFRANVSRCQLDLDRTNPDQVLLVEQLLDQSAEIRNYIVQANCRLAMSIVKKYSDSQNVFDELMSEGITTLIGAVEKYDYSRGFRFSTYATQSIHRRLYRILSQRQKQRKRYVNNGDEVWISSCCDLEENSSAIVDQEVLTQLYSLVTQLDVREQLIIEARFGLHSSGKRQTFVEIGKRLNISKERVRQLAERALLKLRTLAEDLNFDPI